MKKLLFTAVVAMAATCSFGAGFGIYEASARGNAMGGALIGDTGDATANYYNPANLAFATNIQVAAGVTFINPYCDVDVDHKSQARMNPGWFTVPTFYLAVPLPWDFVFGFGSYTEYGLGTKYGARWDLAADTVKTTMRQVTLNPNLAYKATDRWSVAAGLRASWIQFQNRKKPYYGQTRFQDYSGVVANHDQLGPITGSGTLSATDAYNLSSKLKGDDWGVGYNLGTTYKATDDLSFGLIYRSQVRHKIKGRFNLDGDVSGVMAGNLALTALNGTYPVGTQKVSQPFSEKQHAHTRASAKLRLPRSLTGGVNYNITERWRSGLSVTWTQWSSVDKINFKIADGYGYQQKLNWNDAWRFGLGTEYDLLDWLSIRGGYAYDMDPTSKHNATTMLPSGDRHIIGTGLGFRITENLSFDIGYNFIRMNNDDRVITLKNPQTGEKRRCKFSTRNGFSHLASATLRYSF